MQAKPDISLSAARTEARRLVAEKTLGRIRPRSVTCPQAVTVFLEEKRERRKERTVKDLKRHLDLLGFTCQLADVTHQDLERKLKRLPPSEFNHRLACAKTFFTWAQKKRYIIDNPTVGLTPHNRPKRKRIDLYTYLPEMREAMKKWEAFVQAICVDLPLALQAAPIFPAEPQGKPSNPATGLNG